MARDPNKRGALENKRRQSAEEITRAARVIVEAETAARDKKTAKLRALRLAGSAKEGAQRDMPSKKTARRK